MNELLKSLMVSEEENKTTTEEKPSVDTKTIKNPLLSKLAVPEDTAGIKPEGPELLNEASGAAREQMARGFQSVWDSVAHGVGRGLNFGVQTVAGGSDYANKFQQSFDTMLSNDETSRKQFREKYGEEKSGHEIAGEILGTAPLVPMKAVQFWKGAVGAAKAGAPLVNKLLGVVGEGAIGGATYGAATASSNDNSTVENIGAGALTGAVAAPAMFAAGELGANVVPAAKALWARLNIGKIAQAAGIEPSVAKNIIERLIDAGYTPRQAQMELIKLGPKATLMDLDNSLTTEGSGLASLGGKPTAILKNRMEARGKTANNDIVNIINNKLGPKPDLEAEKEAILNDARKATKTDYETAKKSGAKLDIQSVVNDIDSQLKIAVGGKASLLDKVRGYLFSDTKNAAGQPIKVLKNDVASLHEIRQALDDVIEKGGEPETSAGHNALRSIQGVREGIDTQLKTVSEMAAADAKFSQKMGVREGLQAGYDAIMKKTTKEEFDRLWRGADPDTKIAIRKGMRAAIGDYVERASKGELSGAKQLLGSKSVNRENLKLAYGINADHALDALEREASFRATEGGIRSGSQTAERLAVQGRYKPKGATVSPIDLAQGVIADLTTGTSGIGTAVAMTRRYGSTAMSKIAGNRLENLAVGTADILSKQGRDIVDTLNTLNKVTKIQAKIVPRGENKLRLPVTAPAAIGEYAYSKNKSTNY